MKYNFLLKMTSGGSKKLFPVPGGGGGGGGNSHSVEKTFLVDIFKLYYSLVPNCRVGMISLKEIF